MPLLDKPLQQRLLNDSVGLRDFLQSVVPGCLLKLPGAVRKEIEGEVSDLVKVVNGGVGPAIEERRHRAIAALLYLLDPYDAIHDRHGVLGYSDDVSVVKNACLDIHGRSVS